MVTEKMIKKLLYKEFGLVPYSVEKTRSSDVKIANYFADPAKKTTTLACYFGELIFLFDGDKASDGLVRMRMKYRGVELCSRYFWQNDLSLHSPVKWTPVFEQASVFDISDNA